MRSHPALPAAAGAMAALALLVPASEIGAAPAGGRTLLWPLSIQSVILSSFGEYRYDHLHAGIDISTGGATGLKVVAAERGEVFRVKVEWRGYGRAIYLRHPGGRVTVYGHLERFEDAVLGLERRVARRQAEAGTRYPGDIYFDPPLPVLRGQTIGYSGESGVGLPHLHFEVRDREDEPVDPFVAGLKAPMDRLAPILEALRVTSAEPGSWIDGTLREKRYGLERAAAVYTTTEPIRVTGSFLASLEAYDASGGGRSGVHAVRAEIDGSVIYDLAFRAFRFSQYPESGLLYDHLGSHLGPPRFAYRLFRLPGNELAASPDPGRPAGASTGPMGAIDLRPGRHELRIAASDEAGNRSLARLCVLVDDAPPPSIPPPDRSGGVTVIHFALDDRDASSPAAPGGRERQALVEQASCRPATPRFVQGEIWDGRRFVSADCSLERQTCRAAGGADSGEIVARLRQVRGDVPGPWKIVMAPAGGPPPPAGSADVEAWPRFFDVSLTLEKPLDTPLVLREAGGGGMLGRLAYRDGLVWTAALDYRLATEPSRFEITAAAEGAPAIATASIDGRFAAPGEAMTLTAAGVRLDLQAGSRFYPGPMWLRALGAPDVPGLPAAAQAIDLLPAGEALDAPATLSFDAGSTPDPDLRRLGVYRWDPVTDRWSYEGGEIDSAARAVSLRFHRYGRFALLRDDSPPVVTEVLPADGARGIDRRPRLSARVKEIGVGLDHDGVAFTLDGRSLESEFDPDRDTARPFDPPSLGPGRHHLVVVATDRAGNASAPVAVSFEVR